MVFKLHDDDDDDDNGDEANYKLTGHIREIHFRMTNHLYHMTNCFEFQAN